MKKNNYAALERKITALANRLGNIDYEVGGVVREKNQDLSWKADIDEALGGMYTALCVDTVDIWKQNCVRFYCPSLQNPKTPLKSLPWANPISSMGGFDDCGLSWVPPAGSTICLIFDSN